MKIGAYAGAAVPLAKGYIAGNAAKYTGSGMAWLGQKMVNGGNALNAWGVKQLNEAKKVREFIANMKVEEGEEEIDVAIENNADSAQRVVNATTEIVEEEIDVEAYAL